MQKYLNYLNLICVILMQTRKDSEGNTIFGQAKFIIMKRCLLLISSIIVAVTASAQKKPKKINRDTVWTSANRYDTVLVTAEDASGKLVKLHAVYEWGHYAAGKDMPRFHSYLNINRQRFTAAQKPRKIRFDKMKAKGGN